MMNLAVMVEGVWGHIGQSIVAMGTFWAIHSGYGDFYGQSLVGVGIF